MANRVTHPTRTIGPAQVVVVESRAATVEETPVEPFVFLEDSELTITVNWEGLGSGIVGCGLLRLQPLVRTGTIDFFVLPLESYVGSLELAFRNESGTSLGVLAAVVRRRKLASDADLKTLEQHWALSNLPTDATMRRRVVGGGGLALGAVSPAQWGAMARRLIQPVSMAARSISRRPKMAVTTPFQPTLASRVRKSSAGAVLAVLAGRTRVTSPRATWSVDPGAEVLAARDADRISKTMRRVQSELEEGQILDPNITQTFEEARRFLDLLKTRTPPARRVPIRQAVLHDPRYRLLHRVAMYSRRRATTTPSGLPIFRPSTALLYQEWCAWALVEEFVPAEERAPIRSALGETGARRLLLRSKPRKLVLELQHEFALPSGSHTPDLLLTIEDRERVIILDAKYQGEEYRLRKPPADAMNAMHRYRDVFQLEHPQTSSKEIWAAVLFPSPGQSDADWDRNRLFESALDPKYRLGAIPLSPSLRLPLREFLGRVGVLQAEA